MVLTFFPVPRPCSGPAPVRVGQGGGRPAGTGRRRGGAGAGGGGGVDRSTGVCRGLRRGPHHCLQQEHAHALDVGMVRGEGV